MNFARRRPGGLLSLILMAVMPFPVLTAETVAVVPQNLSDIRTLDEIIVKGQLGSLGAAWKAVIEAEDRFYARYNELNKEDAMDIECRFEQPTGTRIPKRTCEPRMFDDISRNEAEKLTNKVDGRNKQPNAGEIQADLKARTLKLLKEDPELLRALLERTRLEQHYEQLRTGKVKGGKVSGD